MRKSRALFTLAIAAAMTASCARYHEASAGGDVISKTDAAKTVVLHVDNLSTSPMELHTVQNGRSLFVGSVAGQDSTNILLDPTLFPTGTLFLVAIPADASGRARVGPLAAGKGDIIRFTVQPALDLSRAVVIR
jgi:hypothetical protein